MALIEIVRTRLQVCSQVRRADLTRELESEIAWWDLKTSFDGLYKVVEAPQTFDVGRCSGKRVRVDLLVVAIDAKRETLPETVNDGSGTECDVLRGRPWSSEKPRLTDPRHRRELRGLFFGPAGFAEQGRETTLEKHGRSW